MARATRSRPAARNGQAKSGSGKASPLPGNGKGAGKAAAKKRKGKAKVRVGLICRCIATPHTAHCCLSSSWHRPHMKQPGCLVSELHYERQITRKCTHGQHDGVLVHHTYQVVFC